MSSAPVLANRPGQSEVASPTALSVALCAWPAVLFCVGLLLPFLNKPFTNDDVTFLLQARQVLADPLHPTAFDMVFHGTRIRLSQELVTGPVMAYLLVPSVLLGGAEWTAHCVQLGLLALAVMATVSLALRLHLDRHQARLASLLLVASPAVLGMAGTAMPDVAAMAFGASGIERLVAYGHSRRVGSGVAAGVLLALAVLARTHVVLLLVDCGLVGTGVGLTRPAGQQAREPGDREASGADRSGGASGSVRGVRDARPRIGWYRHERCRTPLGSPTNRVQPGILRASLAGRIPARDTLGGAQTRSVVGAPSNANRFRGRNPSGRCHRLPQP